jgi:hypothetical protein
VHLFACQPGGLARRLKPGAYFLIYIKFLSHIRTHSKKMPLTVLTELIRSVLIHVMTKTTVSISEKEVNEITAFQRRWPSYGAFAEDAGVSYGTAQQWRFRNSINAEHDQRIALGAVRRGIGTYESVLAELATMRSRRASA